MIDWEAISLLLNATPHTKQMKILQLPQHRWQNTGNQKLKFLEATREMITEDMKNSAPSTVVVNKNVDNYTTCNVQTTS